MKNDRNARAGNLDAESCRLVLERVTASTAFKRAVRLREFLRYVGEQSLLQNRTDLHEQELGEAVFARPRGYDTAQDNIVRVSATELRKRVDAYFATAGKDEPIVFEIPRGSYTPVFHQRSNEPPEPPASPVPGAEQQPAIPAPEARLPSRTERTLLWAVSAIALLLAVACLLLWRQNAALRHRVQNLEENQPSMTR